MSFRIKNAMCSYFWGWAFPYISRIHGAYIGEDSSILGTNEMFGEYDLLKIIGQKSINKQKQIDQQKCWFSMERWHHRKTYQATFLPAKTPPHHHLKFSKSQPKTASGWHVNSGLRCTCAPEFREAGRKRKTAPHNPRDFKWKAGNANDNVYMYTVVIHM